MKALGTCRQGEVQTSSPRQSEVQTSEHNKPKKEGTRVNSRGFQHRPWYMETRECGLCEAFHTPHGRDDLLFNFRCFTAARTAARAVRHGNQVGSSLVATSLRSLRRNSIRPQVNAGAGGEGSFLFPVFSVNIVHADSIFFGVGAQRGVLHVCAVCLLLRCWLASFQYLPTFFA